MCRQGWSERGIVLKPFGFLNFGAGNTYLADRETCLLVMLHPLHTFPIKFVLGLANAADLVIASVGGAPRPDKLMRTLVEDGQLKDSSLLTSVVPSTSVWQVFGVENYRMN